MLQVGDWFKDDLPDLLWPLLVLEEGGNESARRFIKWQGAVQDGLAHCGESVAVAELLDGRLTHLSDLEAQFSGAADVVVREATRFGLLSEGVCRALGSYPLMPVPWLVGSGDEGSPPGAEELQLIHDALLGVLRDRHREALIKCLRIWSTVIAGTFRADQHMIELLKDYPVDPGTRSLADAMVRSAWGSHKSAVLFKEPDHFQSAVRWARVFWGANSMTTGCIRRSESEEDVVEDAEADDRGATDQDDPSPAIGERESTPGPGDGAHLQQLASDVLTSFIEALETAPARLYDNERQEVVSGLVARAGRDLIAVLGARDLWCVEHGSHITRMLVEVKVYLHWMARQDPSIYRQFQEYGAGKAKLYARILDELPAEARSAEFEESIKEFERLSHNNGILDHRVVDTRDSFADGKPIRAMAEEAGLLDFYRQSYQLSSGVSHSEWWSIEAHAMEPCMNLLHGRHLIPSLSLNAGANVQLATGWVSQFYSMAREALQILGTDENAVSSAFEWLEQSADGEGESSQSV